MRGFLFESFETVLLALVVFLVFQASFQNFRVDGLSMDPTLTHGQYLLVNKLVYEPIPFNAEDNPVVQWGLVNLHPPRHGEVIVFHEPSQDSDFVKRIIGVPGDILEMRSGVVYVNGFALQESYVETRGRSNLPPEVVQKGYYFVLGDNRSASYDSRELGPIPLENVVGKAWFTYWPISDMDILGAGLALIR